jgi:hypothetical protein
LTIANRGIHLAIDNWRIAHSIEPLRQSTIAAIEWHQSPNPKVTR